LSTIHTSIIQSTQTLLSGGEILTTGRGQAVTSTAGFFPPFDEEELASELAFIYLQEAYRLLNMPMRRRGKSCF
jgi:hypothetical protein